MSEDRTREALFEAARAALEELTYTCWIAGCVYIPRGDHPACARCRRGRVIAHLKEATVRAEGRCAGCDTPTLVEKEATHVLDQLGWLWREYVMTDPATLTKDAQSLAKRVERAVRHLVEEVEQTRTARAWDEARVNAETSR